ncbi:MAG: bifunctional sugar-1-phosphate nucleotidylyltransferase/acetyltransferase [Candidatus Nanohalobium sp.]
MKAVILAAGESSRFKPLSDKRHKALTHILGKPIIEHTIEELREASVEEVIVVQGPEKNIEEELGGAADRYVVQEEPNGMGHALNQAREFLDDKFLVLTPYRSRASELFEPMMQKAEREDAKIVFVSSETKEPEKYGILDVEDGKATDIVEKPEPGEAPSDRKVVGMYLLSPEFFDHLDSVEEWEYQYEDALSSMMEENPAEVVKIEEEPGSIKYPWDLFDVINELMAEKERSISGSAEIAESAQVKGKVIIEEGATVYENAVVKGPAYIGRNAVVGNNAILRNGSVLEESTVAGANSEIKNSILQPGASTHSGFVGDSIIGRNTKIGAGTIVANRGFREEGDRPEIEVDLMGKDRKEGSGRNSLGCFIGENVDIGVNCSIMPGIEIGSNSKVGPGTVVKENVKPRETVYVDQEQVRKDQNQ